MPRLPLATIGYSSARPGASTWIHLPTGPRRSGQHPSGEGSTPAIPGAAAPYKKAVNALEEFLGQGDDDARRAPYIAESVQVLVLSHLADEFGAVGAHPSESVVDAVDCKHDAAESQRVRRCDRWFDLDQFWIAKLRQLKPPVPIWSPHHNDVDLHTFEPVDAVDPRAFDRALTVDRHAKRREKSNSRCKVFDDDADVVQSFDRHVFYRRRAGQLQIAGSQHLSVVQLMTRDDIRQRSHGYLRTVC